MQREPDVRKKLRVYQKEGNPVSTEPAEQLIEELIKQTPKYNPKFLAQVAGYERGHKPGQVANKKVKEAREKKGKQSVVTITAEDIDANDKSGSKVELPLQQVDNLTNGARYFLADGLNEKLFIDLRNILKDLMKNNENIVYWPLVSLAKQYPVIKEFLNKLKAHLSNQYKGLPPSELQKILSDYEQMPLTVLISANVVLSQPTVSLLDEDYKLATSTNPPLPFTSLTAAGIDFLIPAGTKFENEKDKVAGVHTYFFGPPSDPLNPEESKRRLQNILGSMIEAELDSALLQGISIISSMPRGLVSFADAFKLIKQKPGEFALLQETYWKTFAKKVAQEKYSGLEIYINPLRMPQANEALSKNTTGATVILHDVDLKSLAVNLTKQEVKKPPHERRQVGITNAGDAKALIRLANFGMHFGQQVKLAPGQFSNPLYGQDEMQTAQFLTSIHDDPGPEHLLSKNSDPKKAQADLAKATGIGSVQVRAAAPSAPIRREMPAVAPTIVASGPSATPAPSAPIRKEGQVASGPSTMQTPQASTSAGTWQTILPRDPTAVPTAKTAAALSVQRRALNTTETVTRASTVVSSSSTSTDTATNPSYKAYILSGYIQDSNNQAIVNFEKENKPMMKDIISNLIERFTEILGKQMPTNLPNDRKSLRLLYSKLQEYRRNKDYAELESNFHALETVLNIYRTTKDAEFINHIDPITPPSATPLASIATVTPQGVNVGRGASLGSSSMVPTVAEIDHDSEMFNLNVKKLEIKYGENKIALAIALLEKFKTDLFQLGANSNWNDANGRRLQNNLREQYNKLQQYANDLPEFRNDFQGIKEYLIQQDKAGSQLVRNILLDKTTFFVEYIKDKLISIDPTLQQHINNKELTHSIGFYIKNYNATTMKEIAKYLLCDNHTMSHILKDKLKSGTKARSDFLSAFNLTEAEVKNFAEATTWKKTQVSAQPTSQMNPKTSL